MWSCGSIIQRRHIATQAIERKKQQQSAQPVGYNFGGADDPQQQQQNYTNIETLRLQRRRSESLDPPSVGGDQQRRSSAGRKHHRRNLSMEPSHELARDLAEAVDGLSIKPIAYRQQAVAPALSSTEGNGSGLHEVSHDYAEIYTPSQEKLPHWLHNELSTMAAAANRGTDSKSSVRPPTPPLHRFPSWEAKIYQVANNALVGNETDSQDLAMTNATTTNGGGIAVAGSAQSSQHNTLSGGYCDISVPVYATVKGVSHCIELP